MGYFLWQMKILTPSAGPLMVITSALSPRRLSSFALELSVPNWSWIVIISWMWWRNSYIFERDRCEAVFIIATFAFLVELDLLQKFTNNIILLLFTVALLLFFNEVNSNGLRSICAFAGYSGSDMKNLVKEASMGPLREALSQDQDINNISNDKLRPISLQVC